MKEMTNCKNFNQGGVVKRVLICLALTVALVMAFGAVAYAANWNAPAARDLARWNSPSAAFPTANAAGPYYRGAGAFWSEPGNWLTDPVTGGKYNPMAWNTNLGNSGAPQDMFSTDVSGYSLVSSGGSKYIYLAWDFVDTEVVANTGASSPHSDYQTATVKCAVCHNVHVAAPAVTGPVTNGPGAEAQAADTLLKMRAEDACGYCHVIVGHVVNGSPKWGGQWPLPSGSTYGHSLGGACAECHCSVHGSGADLSIPAIKGLMLTTAVDYPVGGGTVLSRLTAVNNAAAAAGFGTAPMGFTTAEFTAGGDAATLAAQREQAVGMLCGGCHFGSYSQTVAGASTSLMNFSPSNYAASGLFTGHRTMAAATDNWNSAANGVKSSGRSDNGTGFKVAWAPATNCKSCHDSWDGFGNKAFPHGWGYPQPYASNFNPNGSVNNTLENMTGIWLLRGAYAGAPLEKAAGVFPDSRFLAGHIGAGEGSVAAGVEPGLGGSLSDGVCLKCHRGSATLGVGLTF